MQLGRGTVIGGFQLDELVGEGGMGVVYRARQLDLDRVVALKLIQPGLSGDEEFKARFQRESRLAAAIDHPNIVPVYGAGEENGVYFIAMRYVDGTDLGDYLRSLHSPLEPVTATGLIAEVADGLDAAHAIGLVHRDVKPPNILLDSRLHPYLTDFGLTKQVSSQSVNTKTGLWIGSVKYAAPEQIEGGPVDARSDVYALGCVLFEALTRRLPHARDTDMALMYAKVNEAPLLPSQIDPNLPIEFDEVIGRALARRPEDRYQSAGDFGRAAVAAARGERSAVHERTVARGAAAAAPGYEPTQATPIPEVPTQAMRTHRSRNRLAVGVGVLAAAAIVALAAVLITSSGSGTGPATAHAKSTKGHGKKDETEPRATASSPESDPETEATAQAETDSGVDSNRPESAAPPVSTPASSPLPLEPFRGRLYSAEIPAGWNAETIESHPSTYYESHWRDPTDENTSVLIDSQIHSSGSTAMEDAEEVRSETSLSSGYRDLAFEETTLQGLPAARWVFEVEEDRRVDYFVVSCGIGFGILGSTSPSTFGTMAPTFHAVANSVTGNCE
jgi:serine/threonine protein kinase